MKPEMPPPVAEVNTKRCCVPAGTMKFNGTNVLIPGNTDVGKLTVVLCKITPALSLSAIVAVTLPLV
ncbi:MAG: hypothetical protein IPG39_07860 [Bacteroidetes bacterium]|nr:hypothetical protein [Bacteroidota bacterium]